MIKSIELKNFQSHKDTRLDFHPGVNVIVGSSRSGKTAILRALNWNRYNKPAGLAFNSYWNRDKKKQPIDAFSSTVEFEDVSIDRNRSSELNGYISEDKRYEALGQGIPEDVETLWNMSEVNIQKQFDTPFLISESAAEVARFFNKTIHLDKIDVVLSNTESKRRKINSSILENSKLQLSLETEIAAMDWVDDVELMITVAEAIQGRIRFKSDTIQMITDALEAINAEHRKLQSIPRNLDKVLKDIAEAEALDAKIEIKIDVEANLHALLKIIEIQKQTMLGNIAHVRAVIVSDMMDEAKKLADGNNKKTTTVATLETLVRSVNGSKTSIILCEAETKELILQMPKSCPTCGKPL